MNRRKFLKNSTITSMALLSGTAPIKATSLSNNNNEIILATWKPNTKAVAEALRVLRQKQQALDAIEAGIRITEADAEDMSVGYGGLPDRDGNVTLDACIMEGNGKCGSVMFMEKIKHPISVARLVMEKTPHVYLAGDGAYQFAIENGFKSENLLSENSKTAYENWLKNGVYDPLETTKKIQELIKNQHDTIGLLVRTTNGEVSGGCSTSGLAYKRRGRVGDSPVIGAGLYADNEAGAATATGIGEEIARVCGAHLIVELMRAGMSPTDACREAVRRIQRWNSGKEKNVQVGFIAVNAQGQYGAYAMHPEFTYVLSLNGQITTHESDYLIK
jgi:N4-(beta-N-acetylglucosaminyl)-L-asparaginase